MKTLNFNKNTTAESMKAMIDADYADRQPCWYADFENAEDREDAQWRVGIKSHEDSREYIFKAHRAGDVEDDEFWSRVTSADFAVALLKYFKAGGQQAVKSWIEKGCP